MKRGLRIIPDPIGRLGGGGLSVVGGGAAAVPVPAITTLVIQPDETVGKDNYLLGGEAVLSYDTNNGTSDLIQVGESTFLNGGTYRGLLQFDLSSITQSSTVISASIEFTMTLNGDQRASNFGLMLAYFVKQAWTELGSTWNKYDGTNAWQTAGASGANDVEALSIGSTFFYTTNVVGDKITMALTPSQVQRFISGALENNGLLLKMAGEDNDAYRFGSSDHATAGNRPKLTISYIATTAGARQITFSGDSKSNENDSWPALLLDALNATANRYYENPLRLAVAGYTAAQLHTYVDSSLGALSGSPEAVLLNIGANDLIAGTNEATFKAALTGIIDAYLAKFTSTVVYAAYPWTTGQDANALTMKGWIDAVIAAYDGVHVKAGHNENVWFKPNVAAYSYDGTHYNLAGAAEVVTQWLTVLGL